MTTLLPRTLAGSLSIVIALLAASSAQATIYIAAKDHYSPAVAIAAISSGPLVTGNAITGQKGLGFVGWSGAVADIDRRVDTEVFKMMERRATAQEIQAYVLGRIEGNYSRYVFVSDAGFIGNVFPRSGCGTPACGSEMDPSGEFLSMGGGLQPDVVPRAMALFSRIHMSAEIPFACRMLLGLRAIVSVGGEIEKFNSAVIGVDFPGATPQLVVKHQASFLTEEQLLTRMGTELAQKGVTCPASSAIARELGLED